MQAKKDYAVRNNFQISLPRSKDPASISTTSVADPGHFDTDPDPAFQFDTDPTV
jgi:hypothetical protein